MTRTASDHRLSIAGASAVIRRKGAELAGLEIAGRPVLWSGDPAHWGRHAPLLFPFIGRMPDGGLALPDGRRIALPQHGFARDLDFTWTDIGAAHCTLRLGASTEALSAYPFPFDLAVRHQLDAASLTTAVTITNPGAAALPFTFGFHPAFCSSADRAHRAQIELPAAVRANLLRGGLLDPELYQDLPAGIAIDDATFARDALIVRDVPFDRLRLCVPDQPDLEIHWTGMDTLALWGKPGAPFLCIEPWAGTPAFITTTGTQDHPTLRWLAPGQSTHFALTIAWASGPR